MYSELIKVFLLSCCADDAELYTFMRNTCWLCYMMLIQIKQAYLDY